MKEQSIIEIEESSEETFYFNMETDSLIEVRIPLLLRYA